MQRTWSTGSDRTWEVKPLANGNMFVLMDSDPPRVIEYDTSGNVIRTLTLNEAGSGTFYYMALDSDENSYITDWDRSYHVFDSDGTHIRTHDNGRGSADNQLSYPYGITVDPNGNIIVMDYRNKRLVVYDSAGNVLETFGSIGSGDNQFDQPWSVEYFNGRLHVSDLGNSQVKIYNMTSSVSDFIATIDGSDVDLAWTNPSDSDFKSVTIRYSTTGYPQNTEDGTEVTSNMTGTSYTVSGLSGAVYFSAFTLTDDVSHSAPATAYINFDADVTAPSVPSNLDVTATDDDITLTWDNPDDSDFASVMIRRSTTSALSSISDGTLVSDNVTAETYTDLTLDDDTYYYSLFAKDSLSNYASAVTGNAEVDTSSDSDALLREDPLNYPNPVQFSNGGSTEIGYYLNRDAAIDLKVYSSLGNLVYDVSFIEGQENGGEQGYNKVELSKSIIGRSLPAGMYLYILMNEGSVIGKGRMGVMP